MDLRSGLMLGVLSVWLRNRKKQNAEELFLIIRNELEIWRREKPITALPVLIVVLLLIFAYWLVIPVLILGLFTGFRYRFSGPDLERDDLNEMMGSVADTASDLGRQVMDELKLQHDKHDKHKDQNGGQP